MIEKDPASWSLFTWCLLIVVSMAGGISSWYRRVKLGHARALNAIELVGEMATSGLMGFVGFSAGLYFTNDNIAIAAALGGMTAHFSTRLLFQMEGILERAAKRIGAKVDNM